MLFLCLLAEMERDPEKERQKLRKNITEKRWQMGGLNKQGEEKNRVPDTAHDCPILRIGVMQDVYKRQVCNDRSSCSGRDGSS